MPRKGRPFNVQDLSQRYQAGEALEALAVEHQIGQTRLREAFRVAGVPIRHRSAAMQIRWNRLDSQGRTALVAAAHKAARGRPQRPAEIRQRTHARALSHARTGRVIGRFERELFTLLDDRVKGAYPQYPVRGYNLDIAIEPVAVEVHVAANHPSTSPVCRKRIKYLRKRGWSLLYVWITPKHPLDSRAADQVIAAVQFAQRHPATRGQYWVIRGTGENALPGPGRYHRAYVPAPIPALDAVGVD